MPPFEALDLDAQIRSCTEFLQQHGYKVLTMHQRLPGGTREGDPPLTVAEFAAWLGYSQDYVRKAIRSGELKASTVRPIHGGRPSYRLHLADCIPFLRTRGYDIRRVALLERLLQRDRLALAARR